MTTPDILIQLANAGGSAGILGAPGAAATVPGANAVPSTYSSKEMKCSVPVPAQPGNPGGPAGNGGLGGQSLAAPDFNLAVDAVQGTLPIFVLSQGGAGGAGGAGGTGGTGSAGGNGSSQYDEQKCEDVPPQVGAQGGAGGQGGNGGNGSAGANGGAIVITYGSLSQPGILTAQSLGGLGGAAGATGAGGNGGPGGENGKADAKAPTTYASEGPSGPYGSGGSGGNGGNSGSVTIGPQ